MQIPLRQAASYLNVPERTIRRWITSRGLPVHRVNERLYCNAIELWEWALENGVPASKSLFDQARRTAEEVPPLSQLIRRGGVHRDVDGHSRSDVLREVVGVLPLPPEVDADFLCTVLEAREAMGSTGIGDGIAIPHVRNPIVLHVAEPFVSLCLLRHPVDFGAIDDEPVHALFVLVSPSVPVHLRILAHLGFVLRDAELRHLLRTRAPTEAILARIIGMEKGAGGGAVAEVSESG
jgi:nitrogen PTS system EIIA component